MALCTGSAPSELYKVLSDVQARAERECKTSATGKVDVLLRVGTEGSVCRVDIEQSSVLSDWVNRCVERTFRSIARLPRPTSSTSPTPCMDLGISAIFK